MRLTTAQLDAARQNGSQVKFDPDTLPRPKPQPQEDPAVKAMGQAVKAMVDLASRPNPAPTVHVAPANVIVPPAEPAPAQRPLVRKWTHKHFYDKDGNLDRTESTAE